jgi:mitotic spindle assembly checkpoint protein MAD2
LWNLHLRALNKGDVDFSVISSLLPYAKCCSRQPKPEAEIQSEIRAILKQIISMVTYLPVIHEPTVFNILAYTSESANVPVGEWVDTDPLAIEASKSQQVKMRSFSTDVHRIEAMVAYRYEE